MEGEQPMTTQQGKGKGYEEKDVNVRPIVAVGIGLLVFLLLSLLLTKGIFMGLKYMETKKEKPAFFMIVEKERTAAPYLEAQPAKDYQQYLQEQTEFVQSYGWINKQEGIVRIPVDRALQIIAQRGLPARRQEKN